VRLLTATSHLSGATGAQRTNGAASCCSRRKCTSIKGLVCVCVWVCAHTHTQSHNLCVLKGTPQNQNTVTTSRLKQRHELMWSYEHSPVDTLVVRVSVCVCVCVCVCVSMMKPQAGHQYINCPSDGCSPIMHLATATLRRHDINI